MKGFVAGGTGAVGRHAVSALVAAGHSVTALARSAERASQLQAQGARPLEVSLFDRDALMRAFAGHDAVVNLASALPSSRQFMQRRAWERNDHVRIDGSTALVDASIAAGVGLVVQESGAVLGVGMANRKHVPFGDSAVSSESVASDGPAFDTTIE